MPVRPAMQPSPSAMSTPARAPDSPRLSQSPPPDGVQGDLELELMGLVHALYNLGTTVVNGTQEKGNGTTTNHVPPRMYVISSATVARFGCRRVERLS
jgi:hypothetical protein